MRNDDEFYNEILLEDGGIRGPKGESGDAPSLRVKKISPNLYNTSYKKSDYEAAEVFVRKYFQEEEEGIGCAFVGKGDLIGHNYDAPDGEYAEFVVRTDAAGGRHASIGMAQVRKFLTQEAIDGDTGEDEEIKEAYDALPCFMTDGINDAGITVSLNKIPSVGAYPDDNDSSKLCSLFAVRYLLDYADSIESAIQLLQTAEFYIPDSIKFDFYIQIATIYSGVVCDLAGHIVYRWGDTEEEGDIKPIVTDFRLDGWDGTDETLGEYTDDAERYRLLAGGYEDIQTKQDMAALLNQAWRTGDGETQTLHTAIYDPGHMRMTVITQASDTPHEFCMDELKLLDEEIQRATAAERQIRTDFDERYYTKQETDDRIEEADDAVLEHVEETYITKVDSEQAIQDSYETVTEETDEKLRGKSNVPTNGGVPGQVLYKTEGGSEWNDLPQKLPEVTERDNGKVMVVEAGRWTPTDRFADYFRYVNLTVSIIADTGAVAPGSCGIVITVKDGTTGDVINQANFEGQPVSFRIPRGMYYIIEQTGKWEGYHNPTPDRIEGAATEDKSVVFTYEAIRIPETLRELQIIVDGGNASSLREHAGLQFEDTYTENGVEYPVIWDLKDVESVFDADGHIHTAVILQWHYATPTAIPFDAPERVIVDTSVETVAEANMYYYGANGTTYRLLTLNTGDALPGGYDVIYKNAIRSQNGNIIKNGYGYYPDSAPRKWLNSDGGIGEWFFPSHVGDAAPNQAETVPGFMQGCSAQILSMVKPIRVRTAVTADEYVDTVDTFFLPSGSEVNGITSVSNEGEPWQDWVDATGFETPNNGATAGRKIYMADSAAAQEIGLRSANIGYQYIVWSIKADGSMNGYTNANAPRRYTPCCAVYKQEESV